MISWKIAGKLAICKLRSENATFLSAIAVFWDAKLLYGFAVQACGSTILCVYLYTWWTFRIFFLLRKGEGESEAPRGGSFFF